MFFRLIRLSVLLSLSELKEKSWLDRNGFRRMKEVGQIYKCCLRFFNFAKGLNYDLSKFSDEFIPFFRLWKTITKSLGKLKTLRQGFVSMNMMNKCDKFHKDSPSDKKVKFTLPSAIELLETADFVYNFEQKPYASTQLRWHIWPTFPLNFMKGGTQGFPRHGVSDKQEVLFKRFCRLRHFQFVNWT